MGYPSRCAKVTMLFIVRLTQHCDVNFTSQCCVRRTIKTTLTQIRFVLKGFKIGWPTFILVWRHQAGNLVVCKTLTAITTPRIANTSKIISLVKGDDPDTKGYSGPPGWELGVGLTTPPS